MNKYYLRYLPTEIMSRSAVPSHAQIGLLVEFMEERRWLATGHARTSHARDRTQAAWKEIAVKLNSDGSGCIKSWQQWSKYWRDKKAAVRKKASQIRMARQQTGGGALDERLLTAIEEKIVALMGGESFFTGDRELEIELIHPTANEAGPSSHISADVPEAIAEESGALVWSIPDDTVEVHATQDSESILQSHQLLPVLPVEHTRTAAGMLQTEQSTPSIPDVQSGPPSHRDYMPMENLPNTEQMVEPRSPPAVSHRSNAPIAFSSPRRRRLVTTRRRLIQRSPPSQRRSQMASLTERFVAIEERRLENERLLIENQQKMLDIFKEISESWSRQTQALQDLCASIRRGS